MGLPFFVREAAVGGRESSQSFRENSTGQNEPIEWEKCPVERFYWTKRADGVGEMSSREVLLDKTSR